MITTLCTARLAVTTAALVLAGSTAAIASSEPPQPPAATDAEFEAACVFLDGLPSTIDPDGLGSEWAVGGPNLHRLMAAAFGFQAAGAADASYAAVAEHGRQVERTFRELRYEDLEMHLGALRTACSDAPGGAAGPAIATSSPRDSSPAADLPGGSAGAEILDEAGLLDDGVIQIGPVGPDDPTVDAAICTYLFGTSAEVGDVARLDGEVALTDDSGYHQLGGGGDGVRCTYELDGELAFALRLWSQPPEFDEDGPLPVVQVDLDGRTGWGIYAPEYEGERIDEETLAEWLTAAAERYGGASV
jgi:hypothetical protein